MPTPVEYLLLAGHAYVSTRASVNRIPAPGGWNQLPGALGYVVDATSGYEAVAYQSGNEIVISLAGTADPTDWVANIALVTAIWTPEQLYQAAEFYARVRQANATATISFTGHSLGGGLAALLGVFFDRSATTLNPAPFKASANNDVRNALRIRLQNAGLLDESLAQVLDSFHSDQPANSSGPSPEPGIRGEDNIARIVVQNEVLSKNFTSFIGTQQPNVLEHGSLNFSSIGLHTAALAPALVNPQFKAASLSLQNLIPLIFDSVLYSTETAAGQPTVIDHLVRHEFGVSGQFTSSNLLTHFAADMLRIGLAGGQAISEQNVNKALIAFGIQAYYEQQVGFTAEIFTSIGGGLRFSTSTVRPTGAPLNSMKGYATFLSPYLTGVLGESDSEARQKLVGTADWFIAGINLDASAGQDAAFMLGGDQADRLIGSSGADLLVGQGNSDYLAGGGAEDLLLGGAGDDELRGDDDGSQADVLKGGVGFDTYYAGEGDTISDEDGKGRVFFDGKRVAHLIKHRGEQVYRNSNGSITATWVGGTLSINDPLIVEGFDNKEVGIYLDEEGDDPAPPAYVPSGAAIIWMGCPLVLDLNANGQIDTLSLAASTAYFDLQNNGFAVKTGWAAVTEGFLAYDANGNGFVDNRDELFGITPTDANGFIKLRRIAESNTDNVINATDPLFGSLAVWQDLNQDGVSQASELRTLGQLGISEISLAHAGTAQHSNGNTIITTGSFIQNGQTRLAADVNFAFNPALTNSDPLRASGGDFLATVSPDVFELPWLRGYGLVKDLHIAYTENSDVKEYVAGLLEAGPQAFHEKFDALLAKWTGLDALHQVNGITRPAGLNVNDKTWIMETFVGETFFKQHIEAAWVNQTEFSGSFPGATLNGQYVADRYEQLREKYLDAFWAQTFLSGAHYSLVGDGIIVTDGERFNLSLADHVRSLSDPDDATLTGAVIIRLQAQSAPIDEVMFLQTIAGAPYEATFSELINGSFDKMIVGSVGNDVLWGQGGDDLLDGDTGNDYLIGGDGGDLYLFSPGGGQDQIFDSAGADTIKLGVAILPGDVRVTVDFGMNVYLQIDGSNDRLTISHWFENASYQVERIVFDNGIEWDAAQITAMASVATEGPDVLVGTQLNNDIGGLGGNDTLRGGVGDDILRGDSGNDGLFGDEGSDTLDGGSGNDYLNGGAGDDVYIFGAGSGSDYLSDTGGGADVVRMLEGVATGDVTVTRDTYNLFLGMNDGADQLTFGNWFDVAWGRQIERIEFDDGSVWDVADVENRITHAPVNTVPGAQSATEDTAKVIAGISVSDLDAGGSSITTTLTVTNGTVTVSAGVAGGAAVSGNSTAVITLTGSQSAINATLAAATGVTYNPTSNFNGAATLIVVSGDGSTTDSDPITINVGAVNDAPVNAVPGTQSATEDTAKVISGISVADVDSGSLTMTLTVTEGTITVNAGVAGGAAVGGNGTAAITLTGSQSAINTTLADATGVTYNPVSNFNGAATLSVLSNDGAASDSDAVTINVGTVNDAPSFVKGADQNVLEDAVAQSISGWATAINAGPANEFGQTRAFNVTNNTNPGLFAVGPAVAADGTLTYTLAANANGSAAITLTLSDNGGTTNGGADTSAAQVFNITAAPVNDAPVNAVPGTQSVTEDTAKVISGITVADVDSGSLTMTLTAHGTITVNAGVAGGAAVGGNGTAAVTLTGSPSAINATLADATGVTYYPAPNFNGAETLTVVSSDGTESDTDPIDFNVAPVNDAPVNTVPEAQSATEDTDTQIWGISVADVDSPIITMTLTVTNGTAAVTPGYPPFGAMVSGNGTAAVTLTGSPGGINLSLGAIGVIYRPASDFNGPATLTILSTDGAASDTDVITINVAAVNYAPSFTKGADQAVNEDAPAQSVVGWATGLSTGPANESGQALIFNVTNNSNPGLFAVGPAVAANGTLTYTLGANAHGTAAITLTLSDNGGTAGGGVDTSPAQVFNITAAPVNDAPTLANALADQSATEGTAFSYLVPANSFADVDGDPLTYSASLQGGGALPSWLTFTPATRTFSGTPPSGAGAINVQVNATDNQSPPVSDVFALTVQAGGAPPINGTAGDDTLNGTAGNDTINGLAGRDTINGLDGNDILNGGTGVDTMSGGNGDDTFLISGSDGGNYDYVSGGAGFDTVQGGAGDDTFRFYQYNGTNTVERIDGGAGFNVIGVHLSIGSIIDFSGTELLNIARINGEAGADTITGSAGDDFITGGGSNDTLNGGAGNDTIEGGAGSDYMDGGAGDDVFLIAGTLVGYDVVTGGTGFDVFQGSAGDDTFRLFQFSIASSVERIDGGAGFNVIASVAGFSTMIDLTNTELINIAQINGDTAADQITGNADDNVISGGGANDILNGGGGNDTLDGGTGNDNLAGGTGDDTYFVDSTGDVVTENAAAGTDTVNASISYTLGANVENLTLLDGSTTSGTGNSLSNVIVGNTVSNTLTAGTGDDLVNGGLGTGNDILNGDAGNDVLEGMDGNDTLSDTGGNNYLAGFAGTDTLTGSSGNEIFIGGAGNDTISTGTGVDVVAFNRGDGQDTVNASTGQDNTVSLGGSMSLVDLYFRKESNDLILETGQSEQLTLKDWYLGSSNHSVSKLQTVSEAMGGYDAGSSDPLLNKKVQRFNFQELVDGFDQALVANPQLDRWALMDKLLDAHLAGSDTDAIGGDLAYQYGLAGSLAGIGLTPTQTILSDAAFGSTPQTLQPLANLQQGPIRLS